MRSQTQNVHTLIWKCLLLLLLLAFCRHRLLFFLLLVLAFGTTSYSLFSCFIVVVFFFRFGSLGLSSPHLCRTTYTQFCKCLQFLSVEHTNRNPCLSLFRFQHSAKRFDMCFFLSLFTVHFLHIFHIESRIFIHFFSLFLNISLLLLLFSLFFLLTFVAFMYSAYSTLFVALLHVYHLKLYI